MTYSGLIRTQREGKLSRPWRPAGTGPGEMTAGLAGLAELCLVGLLALIFKTSLSQIKIVL